MASSRCSSLKPRVLGIEILDATFCDLTEASVRALAARMKNFCVLANRLPVGRFFFFF